MLRTIRILTFGMISLCFFIFGRFKVGKKVESSLFYLKCFEKVKIIWSLEITGGSQPPSPLLRGFTWGHTTPNMASHPKTTWIGPNWGLSLVQIGSWSVSNQNTNWTNFRSVRFGSTYHRWYTLIWNIVFDIFTSYRRHGFKPIGIEKNDSYS